MLIGDGILTPAISGSCLSKLQFQVALFLTPSFFLFSVLSAMDGLRGPLPSVSKCTQIFLKNNLNLLHTHFLFGSYCRGAVRNRAGVLVHATKERNFQSKLPLLSDHGGVDFDHSDDRRLFHFTL